MKPMLHFVSILDFFFEFKKFNKIHSLHLWDKAKNDAQNEGDSIERKD